MYKHVLIPTDGSELASKAVDEGLRFAKWANADGDMPPGDAAFPYDKGNG